MTYIKKDDVINAFQKLKDAREKRKNCNKQVATEYAIFDYVIKVVETLETYEKD